ncbi:MAG: UDP-N-acetylmuramoyl-L-alanyl-D-glutamate--2,6-diaminopimelate ligase [Pseudomonadota bacterium]|nr:UDP-N-acetylmuramoyl-L-alanyl-D-glutamate--2,6-diaminopimelate ligase [Pseudomonadota bacterium]
MMPAMRSDTQWRLCGLLRGLSTVSPVDDVPVEGLSMDSRQVRPGDLFVACAGDRAHGLQHLDEAISRGAVAIAWEPAPGVEAPATVPGIPLAQVSDLRRRAGEIADRFYSHPSTELNVIGVTGTDGKTSVSQFIAQALDEGVGRCAVVGTLGYGLFDELEPGAHTTPDAVTLQRVLSEFRSRGATSVVMEVSSHALDQARVGGVSFNVAVLTNLSRDHLDYHGDVGAYRAAKEKLFSMPGLRDAVLNLDDDFGRELAAGLSAGIDRLGVTLAGSQFPGMEIVEATVVDPRPGGLSLQVQTPFGSGRIDSGLLGRFNAFNLLESLAVLLRLGVSLDDGLTRLSRTRTVAGRMEPFGGGIRPLVIVDFAHTEAALRNALAAAREHVRGKLWCVFGCGGDRDSGKRPLMGAAAEQGADHVIVTDDNPRSENPAAIASDILSGIRYPQTVRVEHDRGRAIRAAIDASGPGDAVLVAGKGHETMQTGASGSVAFSDRETVAEYLGMAPA